MTMRENPVEALTIINPGSPRKSLLPYGAVAAAALVAIYYSRRQRGQGDERSWAMLGAMSLTTAFACHIFLGKKAPSEITENPRRKYYVRVVGMREVYPKPDSDYYPGGYSLKQAQTFARMGSKKGEPRKVLRGGPGGKHVRTYEDGKRAWPTTAAQASKLYPSERPRDLRN